MRLLRFLIDKQEKRAYHFYTLFSFCIFVGFTRGLEEVIFFRQAIKPSQLLTFVPFYLSLGFLLLLVLSKVARVNFKRVAGPILIGLFLGIFPPVIDFIILQNSSARYGYYFLWNFQGIPWMAYDTSINFPAGEAITIWLSILFCTAYTYIKTLSVWRSLTALAATYVVFIFHSSIFPMIVTRLTVGEITSFSQAVSDMFKMEYVISNISLWQLILTFAVYLALRPALFNSLLPRLNHTLPFVLLSLLGSAAMGEINSISLLMALLIFIAGLISLVQNDFFDEIEDRYLKRPLAVKKYDLPFFNLVFTLVLIQVMTQNSRAVLVVAIAFSLTFLYNYPFYRAKRTFPANLKIEGAWALCSFLSGVLVFHPGKITTEVLILSFLVFGGWSLVSSIKDSKDLLGDFRARNNTLFLFLRRKGIRLSASHKIINRISMVCLCMPPVMLSIKGDFLASILVLCAGIPGIWALMKRVNHKRFQVFLASINIIIIFCMGHYLKFI